MKTTKQEQKEAYEKYGHFNSTHEVYGVLKEEVDEFFDWVRDKSMSREARADFCIHELTQIAAIAERAISELKNNQIKWV